MSQMELTGGIKLSNKESNIIVPLEESCRISVLVFNKFFEIVMKRTTKEKADAFFQLINAGSIQAFSEQLTQNNFINFENNGTIITFNLMNMIIYELSQEEDLFWNFISRLIFQIDNFLFFPGRSSLTIIPIIKAGIKAEVLKREHWEPLSILIETIRSDYVFSINKGNIWPNPYYAFYCHIIEGSRERGDYQDFIDNWDNYTHTERAWEKSMLGLYHFSRDHNYSRELWFPESSIAKSTLLQNVASWDQLNFKSLDYVLGLLP